MNRVYGRAIRGNCHTPDISIKVLHDLVDPLHVRATYSDIIVVNCADDLGLQNYSM